MSIRDRLAGKQRRRAVVPVEVAPATDAQTARAVTLRSQLVKAAAAGQDTTDLTEQLAAVEGENTVEVAFTALDPDVFEKVVATHTRPDGGMDWDTALPVLAALCADDEDLQDDQWWTDQVGSGNWSYGELSQLRSVLLAINSNTPGAYVPKG